MRSLTRQAITLSLVLMTGGCTMLDGDQKEHWLSRLTPGWPSAAKVGQVEVAVIEDALPSYYLTEGLWQEVDEQVVPLERRSAFEANGLRLGIVSGSVSQKLQRLLTNKESCPMARSVSSAADQEIRWPLHGDVPTALFEYVQRTASIRLELQKVEFGLILKLRPAEQGKTLVRVEPYISHRTPGAKIMTPAQDAAAWKLEQPELRLSDLIWEMTLGPNDYLLLGGRVPGPSHFGALAFVDEGKKVQRALLIRGVGRQDAPLAVGTGPAPLAFQAISAQPTSTSTGLTPRGRGPD